MCNSIRLPGSPFPQSSRYCPTNTCPSTGQRRSGRGVAVGNGVAVAGIGVSVAVGSGVAVGGNVDDGVGGGVSVAVGVEVGGISVLVAVGKGVSVAVAVTVGDKVAVADGNIVAISIFVDVGEGDDESVPLWMAVGVMASANVSVIVGVRGGFSTGMVTGIGIDGRGPSLSTMFIAVSTTCKSTNTPAANPISCAQKGNLYSRCHNDVG